MSLSFSNATFSNACGPGGFHLEGFLNFWCLKGKLIWGVRYCGWVKFRVKSKHVNARCRLMLRWNSLMSSIISPKSGGGGVSTKPKPLERRLSSPSESEKG